MKLLLVSHSSNMGGTETCFDRALRHLVARGHDVVAAYPDGSFADEWSRCAPRVAFRGSLPPEPRIKGYAGWLVRGLTDVGPLRVSLRERRPDVVVVFSSVATAAVSAAHAAGVPCIAFVREYVRPVWVQRLLWRSLAMRCERLIAVSAALAADLEEYAPGRIVLISDGVDVPDEVTWRRGEKPLVACYAGYNPAKGADVFVRAAAAVAEALPDARFVLYGVAQPSETAHARRLRRQVADTGLSERFEFRETRAFAGTFDEATIVVVPSLREGLGLVAIEAMAAGVPVVASATGGLLDVVADGKTGLLFDPGSSESLAAALRRALTEENLVALSEAAHQRALVHFSAARSMIDLEEALRDLSSAVDPSPIR